MNCSNRHLHVLVRLHERGTLAIPGTCPVCQDAVLIVDVSSTTGQLNWLREIAPFNREFAKFESLYNVNDTAWRVSEWVRVTIYQSQEMLFAFQVKRDVCICMMDQDSNAHVQLRWLSFVVWNCSMRLYCIPTQWTSAGGGTIPRTITDQRCDLRSVSYNPLSSRERKK